MLTSSPPTSASPSNSQTPRVPSIFDTYICTEPAGDVPLLIRNGPDEYTALLRTLQRSADHFSEKDQTRVVERIQFEQARLHMQHQQWKHAMRILGPLWQTLSWRKSGWWQLLEEVDQALRECAKHVEDAEILVSVQWELLNRSLTPRQEAHTVFADTLKDLSLLKARPKVKLRAENVLSCVSVGYVFCATEGNVGVPLASQLVITSHAQSTSQPITIKQVRIAFEGGLKNAHIEHGASSAAQPTGKSEEIRWQQVNLEKALLKNDNVRSSPTSPSSDASLSALADLTLAAGSTSILGFTNVPREAGEVEVCSIKLSVQERDFELEILTTDDEHMQQDRAFIGGSRNLFPRHSFLGRSNAIRILPKPPKLYLEIAGLENVNYTDETLTAIVNVTNEEEDEADITLDVRLVGPSETFPVISFTANDDQASSPEEPHSGGKNGMHKHLEALLPSEKHQLKLHIQSPPQPTENVLELRARYCLNLDPETPIQKSTKAELTFRRPFEAISSFSAMIHPDPWPNYFGIETLDDETDHRARGLVQRWSMLSRITSLATAPLSIEKVEPRILQVHEAAQCMVSAVDAPSSEPYVLPPGDLQERNFTIDAQKTDLEDRRPTFLDLHLEVAWRREGSHGPVTVTLLPVPELAVPFGEPRVLASSCPGSSPPDVMLLEYVIENPSIYTLTFSLTMETSEEFAFSGVKSITLQLVPLSRHTTRYSLLPLVKGTWISPQLSVYDSQFHKALKVIGTEGIRNDRKGISIWVDTEG